MIAYNEISSGVTILQNGGLNFYKSLSNPLHKFSLLATGDPPASRFGRLQCGRVLVALLGGGLVTAGPDGDGFARGLEWGLATRPLPTGDSTYLFWAGSI